MRSAPASNAKCVVRPVSCIVCCAHEDGVRRDRRAVLEFTGLASHFGFLVTSPIPPFPAPAVEAICRDLAELATGSQIADLMQPLKIVEPPDASISTKWKRLFNAVAQAQNRQSDGRPLIRLIAEVMQPVRFETAEEYEHARSAINSRLLLYGYSIRTDGRVAVARRATSVSEAQERADALGFALRQRRIHPAVLEFCRPELLDENYFHAVLEATKSVADRIREMTGISKDGTVLVDLATSTQGGLPVLAFNALESEWERSEHIGLAMLAKGIFSAIRNPTAHAPKVKWVVDLQDALDVLTVVSLLHRRLDTARVRTSGLR